MVDCQRCGEVIGCIVTEILVHGHCQPFGLVVFTISQVLPHPNGRLVLKVQWPVADGFPPSPEDC